MKKLKNCSGVTLIEILIGIVISVIIMAAMYTSYQAINGSYSQVTGKAKASQTGRNVLGMLMRDLRQAGFKFLEDNIINDDQPISITKNRGDRYSICARRLWYKRSHESWSISQHEKELYGW